MRTHTGVKPYACNKCTYRAAVKSSLTKHMRSKHDTSSPSAAKAPTSKAKLRRCAEPLTLFNIHEFESKADSDCFATKGKTAMRPPPPPSEEAAIRSSHNIQLQIMDDKEDTKGIQYCRKVRLIFKLIKKQLLATRD